jgi:hypothetical protein
MQQRSINQSIIDFILAYGQYHRSRGADYHFMTKASRERLRRHIGDKEYAAIERKLGAGVILSDEGAVITAYHRYRHHCDRRPRPRPHRRSCRVWGP